MKEGSLFVLYLWNPSNQDASDQILGLFGKLLMRRGASAWFHGVWTCGVEVLGYWMISSLKIKLNRSWKFQRNWNVPLVLLERSWWTGFNGIYLIRLRFRMWETLIYKWFLLLKIQINSQKTRFWKENFSWERHNTWRLTIKFKHDFLSYSAVQKIDTYIDKQCSHVEFPYFVMGSQLGQRHRPHEYVFKKKSTLIEFPHIEWIILI
jgi:hypothetical protein